MNLQSTLEISEDDLKEIVKEHLERNGWLLLSDINVNIGTETVGYGTAERSEAVFKNVTVKVSASKSSPQINQ